MKIALAEYKAAPRRVDLGPKEAITLRAERGTEVRVEHGLVWITQAGDGEDYIVAAGTRFCSGYRGSIVVTTLSAASRISVSWTDPRRTGGYARSGVWLDYGRIEELEHAARRARAQALAQLARDAIAWFAATWRRLTRRRRTAGLASR